MDPRALANDIAEVASHHAASQSITISVEGADIALERPKSKDHGDWATSIALKLAKDFSRNPRELATELAAAIEALPGVAKADVAGPGFINITLDAGAAG